MNFSLPPVVTPPGLFRFGSGSGGGGSFSFSGPGFGGGSGQVPGQTSTSSSTSLSGHLSKPPLPPPPGAPDYKVLNQLRAKASNSSAIKTAMQEFDDLEAATSAMGMQSAQNAGNVYSNRLMQAGVNPVSSGVVAAQAKLPVYKQLHELGAQKETFRVESQMKADALAAQIASTVAGIQMNYASMLADYNKSAAGIELDWSKLQSGESLSREQMAQQAAMEAAKLRFEYDKLDATTSAARAASGAGQLPQYQGPLNYVPNSGPLTEGHPGQAMWAKTVSVPMAGGFGGYSGGGGFGYVGGAGGFAPVASGGIEYDESGRAKNHPGYRPLV